MLRLVVATLVMAGVLYLAAGQLDGWLASSALLPTKLVALSALVVLAMTVYFGTAFLIGGADLGMIRRNVRRKSAADTPPAAEE